MNSYAEIDTKKDVSDFGALDMFFRYVSCFILNEIIVGY